MNAQVLSLASSRPIMTAPPQLVQMLWSRHQPIPVKGVCTLHTPTPTDTNAAVLWYVRSCKHERASFDVRQDCAMFLVLCFAPSFGPSRPKQISHYTRNIYSGMPLEVILYIPRKPVADPEIYFGWCQPRLRGYKDMHIYNTDYDRFK